MDAADKDGEDDEVSVELDDKCSELEGAAVGKGCSSSDNQPPLLNLTWPFE